MFRVPQKCSVGLIDTNLIPMHDSYVTGIAHIMTYLQLAAGGSGGNGMIMQTLIYFGIRTFDVYYASSDLLYVKG